MPRSLMLIDGENLVTRFEEMVKAGWKSERRTKYLPGRFVWNPELINYAVRDEELIRVSFYMSVVGDDEQITSVRDEIGNTYFTGRGFGSRVCPHVFKKPRRSDKSKNVDIGITIDALRHAFLNHIDHLYLVSGDGDYVPLVKEVMRQGKKVSVGALSSGLNHELARVADSFADLDKILFEPKP